MNFKGLKRIMAAALAFCVMAASTTFVLAEETETARSIQFLIEDITASDVNTLQGEAKIRVSVKGEAGTLQNVQATINFPEGELKYKSIQFKAGSNNLPYGYQQATSSAKANAEKSITAGIVSLTDGIAINNTTPTALFDITFEGTAGKTVNVVNDITTSKCTYTDDVKGLASTAEAKKTITASSKANEGAELTINMEFDKLETFASSSNTNDGYNPSDIFIKITNDSTGYALFTDLNNVPINNGGHRDNTSTGTHPKFAIKNTLVKGNYTLEIWGSGYVTYNTPISLNGQTAVEIKNDKFIPGDIVVDGVVNADDKTAFEAIVNKTYKLEADYDRDGKVTADDYKVFDGISSSTDGDTTGGNTGNTGNGESTDNGGSTGGDNGGTGGNGGDSGGGGGGGAGGGGGSSSGGGAGGGGSTGGGSSMGGGSFGGGTTTTPTNPTKTFTDLANYGWAENAIYTLKAKGIISGTSETEYAPANNIKRGDFILILTRMLKLENTFTENFADVPTTAYYYDALGKAKAAGIASGDGVNFMPENTITRQDLITLAYRAFLNAGYRTETTDYSVLDQFAEKAEITDYAQAPLASMVAAGIITGDGANVNPKGFATRAEVAVMCERLLALIK